MVPGSGTAPFADDTASITDYTGNLELSFLDFSMDEEPKYSIEECKARDATYATPLKVRMRLRNKETGEIKEQEIFMGDFPKMTDSATFIINGAERAIVSQLVPFPGVYYGREYDKTDKLLLSLPLSHTAARGSNMRPMQTTFSTFASIKTAKSRSPALSAPSALRPTRRSRNCSADPLIVATPTRSRPYTRTRPSLRFTENAPGRAASVGVGDSLMDAMFFDVRRYDISAVSRYKYNKKLDIARRITGHKLLEPVVDPMTGEVLAEAGEVLTPRQGACCPVAA